jgi:hypothetical protein
MRKVLPAAAKGAAGCGAPASAVGSISHRGGSGAGEELGFSGGGGS